MTSPTRIDEFEIKARADGLDTDSLTAGMQLKTTIDSVDQYFDTPTLELFTRGVFIRVRDGVKLQVKFSPNDDPSHTYAIEESYSWPLSDSDIDLVRRLLSKWLLQVPRGQHGLNELGLLPLVDIRKRRSTFWTQGLTVSLDDVEDLGTFIEIEANDCTSANRMYTFCEMFGLQNLGVGYVELILRAHRPHIYKQGLYLLEEDR